MLQNSSILITGGTGSFGRAFVEELLRNYAPRRVIVYSRDEFKQDRLMKELSSILPDQVASLRFFIGDVRDRDRLYRALNGVDYVVHAAAMKQVPLCEYNPFEAIKTNINGAQNVIDAAIDNNVKKVIALSTDKAVNPINLYGGTKLVSDRLFVSANSYSGSTGTKFAVVRYGNVVGSRGSVVPYFLNLASSGANELPVTDNRMTRFWIDLPQGIDLVIMAIKECRGGEIYISKIPSIRITDLAEAIIPNCSIREIGIREGEKLHEVMIARDDSRLAYEYDKHYIVYPHFNWWSRDIHYTDGGKLVSEGFEYCSSTNEKWLSSDAIRAELIRLGYMG